MDKSVYFLICSWTYSYACSVVLLFFSLLHGRVRFMKMIRLRCLMISLYRVWWRQCYSLVLL